MSRRRQRTVRMLILKYGNHCCYCGGAMSVKWRCHDDDATLEHLVDRKYGGTSKIRNLRLAHKRCNNGRSMVPLNQKLLQLKLRGRMSIGTALRLAVIA